MRLIDAEPIEWALFKLADKSLAKNPYENARICAYRRVLERIIAAPTITLPPATPPPNDPLTLEQLREMDGEPVWIASYGLNAYDIYQGEFPCGYASFYFGQLSFNSYQKSWLAYRRKPEGPV